MTNKPIIQKIVLAGIVFNKQGKVLVLQRNENENTHPGMWELPSGKREFLESSHNALTREIKEETGLDIEVVQPCSVFEYKIEKPNEIRDSTQINFIVTSEVSEVRLSEEHQNYAWISKNEINRYKMSVETKEAIQLAFDLYSKIL
ncbi:MAG: NUDIX hydrolase [Patescibacteria group bacterium]|nr:NUDIX hydrolase [Patescibacteria group bacterium]